MAGRPPDESWPAELPVVVGLGPVDPALVAGVLDGHCRFVAAPGEAELAAAAGAIVRADARVVGLDVFDPEPPGHHPLFSHPDVVLTPHLMGLSQRATAATFAAAARGVLDVLSGREPQAVADPAWRARCPKEINA
jgi:hypothetical protein